MRIVSLLPSATEILFALGLDREIVGVSHECDYPPQARAKPVVIHSRLPHGAVVVRARLHAQRAAPEAIAARMAEIRAAREASQPVRATR